MCAERGPRCPGAHAEVHLRFLPRQAFQSPDPLGFHQLEPAHVAPLELVSDNGCQPTSAAFMAACHALEIRQIFTSYPNPKGNADTERCLRTLKEDLIWPNEWFSFQQLHAALERWVRAYNTDFPHSSLDYRTPQQYEDQHAGTTQPITVAQ